LDPGGVAVSQFLPLYDRESSPYKMRTLGSPDLGGGAQSVGTELDIYGERDPDLTHQWEFRGGYSKQHTSPLSLKKNKTKPKINPKNFHSEPALCKISKQTFLFLFHYPYLKENP
jgi:hypothetical protein